MPATSTVTASGNQDVDGLLSGVRWASGNLTYSFPASAGLYGSNYSTKNEPSTFGTLNATQQRAATEILEFYASVANVTFTNATGTSDQGTLRFAMSSAPNTAWALLPFERSARSRR